MFRKLLVLSVLLAIVINSLEAKHTPKATKHSSPHHSTRQNGHQRKLRQVVSDPQVAVDPESATALSPVDDNSTSSEETNSTNYHSHGNRTHSHHNGNRTHHQHKHREHAKNLGRNKGQQHKQEALEAPHGKLNQKGEKNKLKNSNKKHGKNSSENNSSNAAPDLENNLVAGRPRGEEQEGRNQGDRESMRGGEREGLRKGGRGDGKGNRREGGRDDGGKEGRFHHRHNFSNFTNSSDNNFLDNQVVVREHLHPVQ